MKFVTPIWHPNVYPSGEVCISILHEPGDDITNPQEPAELRWSPVHSVESIVLSVISMLSDPNGESPANPDAAVVVTCILSYQFQQLFCPAEAVARR